MVGSIVIVLVCLKLLVFFCCGTGVSFGQKVLWILAELLIVQGLCLVNITNWDLNVCGFLICIGSSGVFLVWGTLHKQMQLVCLGMTLKEEHSRLQQMRSEY